MVEWSCEKRVVIAVCTERHVLGSERRIAAREDCDHVARGSRGLGESQVRRHSAAARCQ